MTQHPSPNHGRATTRHLPRKARAATRLVVLGVFAVLGGLLGCGSSALCVRGRSITHYARGTRYAHGQELLLSAELVLRERMRRDPAPEEAGYARAEPGRRAAQVGARDAPCRVALLCAWQATEQRLALTALLQGPKR
jgi:hypothetical protein